MKTIERKGDIAPNDIFIVSINFLPFYDEEKLLTENSFHLRVKNFRLTMVNRSYN